MELQGDVDNDGDADLYLSVADESPGPLRHLLYINRGDGSFVEQAQVWGGSEAQFLHSGFSICFGDYNLDGRLDIHTCQWGVRGPGNRSVLLMNRGELEGFQDVTSNAEWNCGTIPRVMTARILPLTLLLPV